MALKPSAFSPSSAAVSVAPPHATTASTLLKLTMPARSCLVTWPNAVALSESARIVVKNRMTTSEVVYTTKVTK